VTRSAVIVAGPEQMSLWRRVVSDGGRTPALGTVTLRGRGARRRSTRLRALLEEERLR
jgi:hypothetical protein